MGRRAEHTRDQQIEMALTAARDILRDEGRAGLTARAVAQRMGYSVGSIYNLFENMGELLMHVNLATLVELSQAVEAALRRVEQPADRIKAMAHAYLAYAAKHPYLWRSLFDPQVELKGELPAWYGSRVRSLFAIIERELDPYLTTGSDRDKQLAARTLWTGVHGVSIIQLSDRTVAAVGHPPLALADALVATFLGGLEATAGLRT